MTHPVTPPPELLWEWHSHIIGDCCPVEDATSATELIAVLAAEWGADQELQACCELLRQWGFNETLPRLQRIRRPKPASAKEQALTDLGNAYNANQIDDTTYENILRALEALPE